MSLFQALDESEKSPGHGWNTSSRFGLDSTNGGGKQYDSQGSSTNIFHHLIHQNNTGEVPDALAEEEVTNDNEVQTDCSFNLNQQQQQKQQQQQQQQNQHHMQQIQQQQQNALQHQFQQQQMQKQHLLNQQQQQQKQAMMNSAKQVLPQPSPRGKTPQQQQQQKSSYPVLNNNKQPQQHTQLDQQQQHQLLQQQQLQTQISRQHQQQQSMQQQMLSQAQSQSARLQQQHAAQQQMISQAQMQNRLLQQQQQQGLKQQSGQNMNMQQGVGRSKPLPQQHYNQHHQLVQQQLSQQLAKNSVEKIEEDLNRQLLQTEQEIEENNKKLAMFGLPPVSVQHSQLQTVNNCDYLGSVRVNNSGNQPGSGDGRIRTMLTHSKETLQKKGNVNAIDSSAPVNQNAQRQAISHGQVGGQVSGQQPRTPIITVSTGQRQNLTPQSQMVRSPMKSGIVQLPSHSMPGNRPTSTPTQSPVQVQTVSTNQSLIRQPSPAMQKISKSNVVLEGGGQFEEGQAYVIKDRHGNSRTMVWTNGEFVPYDKDKGTYNQIQHSTIDSSQRGRGARGGRGGKANRGRGQLQGNATGVHMTQNIQGNSPLMNNGLRQVHPNGPLNKTMSFQGPGHPQYHQQLGHMTTPGHVIHQSQSSPNLITVVTSQSAPGQVSVQRPKLALQNLMPAQQIKQKSGDTGQNEVQPSTSAENVEQKLATTTIITVIEKDAQVLDPPNVPDDPTACAVCQFCGTTSTDKYKCESCKRMFTSATKYVIPKLEGEGDIKRRKLEPPNTVAILTAGVDKSVFYQRKLQDQGDVYLKVISATNPVTSKTPRIIRSSVAGRGRRGRGWGRGMAVPELVTISSDEEDGGNPNLSVSRSAPATPVPSSRSPSQHGDQLEGPELIPIIPVSKRIDKARVKKMEDAEGANARENSPSPPPQFTLTARTIRVGTFRGAPVEPVLISQNGLSFFIEGVTGTHRFVLFPQEIQQCLAKFDSEPNLIFFLTNEGCAGRTRKDLGMAAYSDHTKPPPELYFNPSSLEMRHQMITIVSDQLSVETRLEFQKYMELFKSWGKQGDEAFFMELSKEEADEIYRQSTTTTPLTHFTICTTSFSQGEEDRQGDRSPSPKIGFVGPVIKLLTYPPPPEKGGISITNEDLYCLQEGEFLNDVIIDFYLKYLLRDRLSAEDRERTHIFSSFFYKRLTQRIRGAAIDDDPNITLAEKRHARVKTWTRHVDLFKKDFIVVPINEHAHWFLAIICFPSLDKPVENPYIPKLVSNSFLDTASVPTPPQPTEDGQEDMETEESEDPYNEMEAGAPQVKMEKQEEVAALETNGQTKELAVEKDKAEKQSTEAEQSKSQSEEKTESQSEQTDSQAEKSEDQSDKSESQSEKTSTQSDTDGANTETAESLSEKQNSGKEESNSSNSSEKASEKSNVIQKADGTQAAEKSVTKGAKVPKTPVLVKSIRGKAIPKSDPVPPEASVGIRQPCIIIFDSLFGPSRSRIIQVLKEYLQVEWAVKKGGTELNKGMIKGCTAKVQQQTNYSDCGVYMLQYVESFFEDPIQDFSIPLRLVDWFSIPKIEAKREEIRDLVIELKEKYESKNNT